jgi:hypothetical protein
VYQGDPKAKGGKAKAEGGDGGDADTGNKQVLNGNSIAVSVPLEHGKRGGHKGHDDAKAEGGDTSAKSGDAYGGDGGDAKASGGDANASNDAESEQVNWSKGEEHGSWQDHGHKGDGYGDHGHKGDGPKGDGPKGPRGKDHGEDSQENLSWIHQGDPKAKGGKAKAEGGDGGDADTGNVQFGNGNALAFALGGKAKAEGGDTCADSGDAYGGDGGDAKAIGGDADASNVARVFQLNAPWKGGVL